MKKIILPFILLIAVAASLLARKEANNWYFGYHAGMTFNTSNGKPSALFDGKSNVNWGRGVISDTNGRLQFYTNGGTYWNRNHDMMQNGNNWDSASRNLMIIPQPRSNKYYIFNFYSGLNDDNIFGGYTYSTIDMDLNYGLGDVIKESKSTLLLPTSNDQITAVKHRNGTDVWVVIFDYKSLAFNSYLVNENGLNTTPVVSTADLPSDFIIVKYDNSHFIKASPDGSNIVSLYASDLFNKFSMYDFNDETGAISKHREIKYPLRCHTRGYNFPDIEYSCDGTKLYINIGLDSTNISSQRDSNAIIQYDLLPKITEDIEKTAQFVSPVFPHSTFHWGLQLGPDNRIYIMRNGEDFISCIDKPNLNGEESNYIDKAVNLWPFKGGGGFPYFISSYFYCGPGVRINATKVLCEGDTIKLFSEAVTVSPNIDFEWTGPKGYISNQQNPVIPDAAPDMSGYYKVKITVAHVSNEDSIYVIVNPKPEFDIIANGPTTIAKCDNLNLKVSKEFYSYQWSTGEISRDIDVNKPGIYSVTVTDDNGCTNIKYIEIYERNINILESEGFDFGFICLGGAYSRMYHIKYNDKLPIQIDSFKLKNDDGIFSMSHYFALPLTLNPEDSLSFLLNFFPQKSGEIIDSLIVCISKPCFQRYAYKISGIGIEPFSTVQLPDTTAYIGDQDFHIPIKAKVNCLGLDIPECSFKTEIRFDAFAFFPYESQFVKNMGVENQERIVQVSGNNIQFDKYEINLSEITGMVLFSDAEIVPLKFTKFDWNNPFILNDTINGSLRINSICQRNLSRVKMFLGTELQINPNPATDEVDLFIKTDEIGQFNVNIYNTNAEKFVVKRLYNTNDKFSEIALNLKLNGCPSGLYEVVLQTPNRIINQPLLILK